MKTTLKPLKNNNQIPKVLIKYYEVWKDGLMTKGILTAREKEVFLLLVENKTTKEIASLLKISEKTVRNHISNTMQKLGVKSRSQAVVELLKLGEISI